MRSYSQLVGPQHLMQCLEVNDEPQDFLVEYRDGSADTHFRAADDPITLDQVLQAFTWYLEGNPAWRSIFQGERLELE